MWLIVFGLVNAYLLLWPGDILYYYGVVGLLLFVCPQRRAAQADRRGGRHHGAADRSDGRRVVWLSRSQCRRSPRAASPQLGQGADRSTEPGDREPREDQRGVQTVARRHRERGQPRAQELRQRARPGGAEELVLRNHVLPAARPARMPRHDAARHGAVEIRRADGRRRRGASTRTWRWSATRSVSR